MKITTAIDLICNHLEDSERKEIAKIMIDTLEKPSSLFSLKKYIEQAIKYEKAKV